MRPCCEAMESRRLCTAYGPIGTFASAVGPVSNSLPSSQPVVISPQVSLTLDRADPLDPNPTGISLTSTPGQNVVPIGVNDLETISWDLQVVDHSGRVWPVTWPADDATAQRSSVLFNDPIPAGHYTVSLPQEDASIDHLSDPRATLTTFDVKPRSSVDPLDLGALLPGPLSTGAGSASPIPAGGAVTFRYVVTFEASYILWCRYVGGDVIVSGSGPDGAFVINPGQPGALAKFSLTLKPGIYLLTPTVLGSETAFIDWDLILANGVGQAPALNLQLVASPGATTDMAGPGGATYSNQPTTPLGPQSTPATALGGISLSVGGGLIGQVNSSRFEIAAVGPASDVSSGALASATTESTDSVGGAVSTNSPALVSYVISGANVAETSELDRAPVNGAIVKGADLTLAPAPFVAAVHRLSNWKDAFSLALSPASPAGFPSGIPQSDSSSEANLDELGTDTIATESAYARPVLGMWLATVAVVELRRRSHPIHGRMTPTRRGKPASRPPRLATLLPRPLAFR
jgi:hypothetical protein